MSAEFKTYMWNWFSTACSQSLGTADLWSSVIGAALAIIVHFFPKSEAAVSALAWQVPLWVLAGVIFMRFMLAPYWIWKDQNANFKAVEDNLRALQETLKPKLSCSFDENEEGCVEETPPSVPSDQRTKWYRITVRNLGQSIVPHCIGRLVSITMNGDSAPIFAGGEPVYLPIVSPPPIGTIHKDIYPDLPEHLDVFLITSDNKVLVRAFFHPESRDWANMFSRDGEYVFAVKIISPLPASVDVKLRLHWTGEKATAKVTWEP